MIECFKLLIKSLTCFELSDRICTGSRGMLIPLSVLNLEFVDGNHRQSELIEVTAKSCLGLSRCDKMRAPH
jgi:hypothetical protein